MVSMNRGTLNQLAREALAYYVLCIADAQHLSILYGQLFPRAIH